MTVGNLAVRLFGCAIVLPFSDQAASALCGFAYNPAQLVVDAHIAFNLLLAAIMLPLLDAFSWAMRRLLPEAPIQGDGPRHLDQASLGNPAMALAGAVRETLHIGDSVTSMLQMNLEALRRNDTKLCSDIAAMDDEVDRLNEQIKLYLSELNRTTLEGGDERRSAEIVSYAHQPRRRRSVPLRHPGLHTPSWQFSFLRCGADRFHRHDPVGALPPGMREAPPAITLSGVADGCERICRCHLSFSLGATVLSLPR
ncbi:PhoU domain-containing protein [Mesorhizobium temperatum]|uniref:PhoU domain-containing protein n=1 Tax=Mesorhizobium temperatum TaxID=241416 RepID=UPI001FD8C30F|nr:PhoU domain-containing protein [Mesorhizobium temperatum]